MKIKATKKPKLLFQHQITADAWGDLAESAVEEQRISVIQVFPRTGKFYTHHQQPDGFEFTEATFDEFVKNFNEKKAIASDIPVFTGHGETGTSDRPARGWIQELINKGSGGLWAVVKWTWEGAMKVRDGEYRYISPEWFFDFQKSETGEEFQNVLSAIALVNEPYFDSNMPVTASEKHSTKLLTNKELMNFEELRKKAAADLTADERAFLEEHKAELTDEERAAFFPVKADEADDKGGEGEGESKEDNENGDEKANEAGDKAGEGKQDGDGEKGEGADDKGDGAGEDDAAKGDDAAGTEGKEGEEALEAARGKKVTITAARFQELTASEKELTASRVELKLGSMKSLVPAAKTLAKAFALKLTVAQRDELFNVLEAASKTVATTRKSDNDTEGADKEQTIAARAKEKVTASNGKMSISDAIHEATVEYHAELNKK